MVGLFFVDPQRYSLAPSPGYGSFSQAALLLVFAYTGFEGAAIPTGEMRDPARHLPFALLTGLAVVVLVYLLVQTVCIGTLPDLAHSERPLSDASLRFLGAPGASLIAAGALVSIGGALNAQIFATPRLLFAMGENRQLPQIFSTTHVRFRTPIAAIVLTSMVALSIECPEGCSSSQPRLADTRLRGGEWFDARLMAVSIADDAVLDIGNSYLRTGPVRRWEALHENASR